MPKDILTILVFDEASTDEEIVAERKAMAAQKGALALFSGGDTAHAASNQATMQAEIEKIVADTAETALKEEGSVKESEP